MFRRLRNERGQALVEFVIVLPLLLAVVFVLASLGQGYMRQVDMTDAAQNAARAASVYRFSGQPTPCDAAYAQATNDGYAPPDSTCAVDGDQVTVTIDHDLPISIPFLPSAPASIHLHSTVTARVE
jgi:Flp pilus assembly protein TadG